MQFRKIHKKAKTPERLTPGSAGYDLYSIEGDILLMPGESKFFEIGIELDINDNNLCGFIVPRSGLACLNNLILANSVGVIDSDYNKEIKVCLFNNGYEGYKVERESRIAQLVFMRISIPDLVEVNEFDNRSSRGGFGSTGVK
jgi:dUTP pyrophosphatase